MKFMFVDEGIFPRFILFHFSNKQTEEQKKTSEMKPT